MKQLRALVVTSWVVGSGCALDAAPPPLETTQNAVGSAADGTETYVWTRRAEPLLRRLEPTLTDQPTRGRVLLYGGWTTDGILADTWEWDGIGWIRRVPAENPGPRFSASATFDTAQGRALLFGGLGRTAPQLELAPTGLWEWNGTSWARVLTRTTPAARVGASLVWDDTGNRAWMFGGGTGIERSAASELTNPSDELWMFDGNEWSQIPKAGAWPSARSTSSATWDRARGRMVMHGGYTRLGIADGFLAASPDAFQSDTWDWDGTTWTAWADGALANEQGAPALAFDPVGNSVTLVAETPFASGSSAILYRGDGTRWSAGPARPLVDLDYDPADLAKPARSGTLAFAKSTWSSANGGFLGVSGLEILGGLPLGSLYQHDWVATWDGGWKRYDASLDLEKTGSPGTASLGGNVFVFGGVARNSTSNGFHFWDGGRWAGVVPSGELPPVRRDPGMAALGDRIVVFGGRSGTARLKDTWVWTRTPGAAMTGVWTNVTPASGGPAARYGMMMIALGDRIVMFGGEAQDGSALADTWSFEGTTWTKLAPALSPSARRTANCGLGADGVIRLVGGATDVNGSLTIVADFWTFAFVGNTPTWSKVAEDTGTHRRRAGVATDPARGLTLLYGGSGDNARSEIYDVTAAPALPYTGLVREPNQERPRRRYYSAFAANPASGGFLSFGGFSNDADESLDDTWQLQQLGAACTQHVECGHGSFCTEGVCCESSACGPCNTCAAAGTRGLCSARGVYGPQPGCDQNGHVCSKSGHCRLEDQQQCSENDACASGTCLGGEGTGICCTAAGCAVRCVEGSNDLQTPDGTTISCGAYGCAANQCKSTCSTVDDCAAGAVCNDQKQCIVTTSAPAADDSGCSCQAAGVPATRSGLCAFMLLALAVRRRAATAAKK